MGIPFANGLQYVMDTQQNFVRAGLPVYLRVSNFTEEEQGAAAEVGVPFAPTGTLDTGFTDILVSPAPWVKDVSLHNIGLFGGRLNFGSTIFTVSNTFVAAQMQLDGFIENNVTDPYQVWRNRDGYSVIGIFYSGRLYSLDSITHMEVAGQTISWKIVANAQETATTVLGGI